MTRAGAAHPMDLRPAVAGGGAVTNALSKGSWCFGVAALLLLAGLGCAPNRALRRADDAFARRDDPAQLRAAVKILEALPQPNASQYDVLWRLAKYRYHLSTRQADDGMAADLLQSAIATAQHAVQLDPSKPEAHFWLAAAYGELAGNQSPDQALALVPLIRREYEATLAIDPLYANGSAWEALGDLDVRLPSFYGGDRKRGVARLEQAVKLAHSNADVHIALARLYATSGRPDDARRLLAEVFAVRDPLKTAGEQKLADDKARDLEARIP